MRRDRAILWDFDGTLAERAGMWGACLCEVLDQYEPGHDVTPAGLIAFLGTGFPWHTPDVPHPQLSTGESWWSNLRQVLARALVSVGVSSERASELVEHARECYLDTAKWRLFDDTLPVLSRLLDSGWRHVILSNHVPELPDLVDQLGLGSLVEATVSSALTGYEKPHPEMFRLGRASAGEPDTIWMVGDNPAADVRGAEAVGIPAILVRRTPEELSGIVRHSPDLAGVARWL